MSETPAQPSAKSRFPQPTYKIDYKTRYAPLDLIIEIKYLHLNIFYELHLRDPLTVLIADGFVQPVEIQGIVPSINRLRGRQGFHVHGSSFQSRDDRALLTYA